MTVFKRASINSSSPTIANILGASSSDSGVRVNVNSVMGLPAFVQATRLISNSVARCDCHLYTKETKGGRFINDGNVVNDIVARKASPFQTSYNFFQTLIANAIWSGNGFALIERDSFGDPIALYNLDSRSTYVVSEFDNGRLTNLWYAVNANGQQIIIPSEDVVHIRNLSLHTGEEGLSLVDSLKTSLGLSLSIQKYGCIYFKNGSHINKVLKIPGWLTPEQQQELRSAFSHHSGIENAHRLSVLMGGTELDSMPISNEEGQWLGSRSFSTLDIANIVGLPASFLNSDASGTRSYGSLEQDSLNLLNHTLDAWLTCTENELSSKLLSGDDRRNSFVEFDRASLFATDPAYIKMITDLYHAEAISWQEMREKLNMTTNRKGLFVRPNLVTDPSMPVEKPAVKEAPKEEPIAELAEAAVKRIKTRLTKSLKNDPDLTKHYDVIRDNLKGLDADKLIDRLETMQGELNEVLPEQREAIIERLDITEIIKELI